LKKGKERQAAKDESEKDFKRVGVGVTYETIVQCRTIREVHNNKGRRKQRPWPICGDYVFRGRGPRTYFIARKGKRGQSFTVIQANGGSSQVG